MGLRWGLGLGSGWGLGAGLGVGLGGRAGGGSGLSLDVLPVVQVHHCLGSGTQASPADAVMLSVGMPTACSVLGCREGAASANQMVACVGENKRTPGAWLQVTFRDASPRTQSRGICVCLSICPSIQPSAVLQTHSLCRKFW